MGATLTLPHAIDTFYRGNPVTDADAFARAFAPDATLEFIGPHAPKDEKGENVVIPAGELRATMANMIAGFSNFTFNPDKVEFTKDETTKAWSATIKISGTHDGAFTFAPGEVEPLAPTGREIVMGPETFTFHFTDDKETTIKKWTVEPLADAPSGPPGFYVLAGGSLPNASAATAA